MKKIFAPATALGLALGLSACGGGDGGVNSTPVASYDTLDKKFDKDTTFQTVGQSQSALVRNSGPVDIRALGAGVTIAYDVSEDSYTLTAPSGYSVVMTPEDYSPTNVPDQHAYIKSDGPMTDRFSVTRPSVGGAPLTYVLYGSWNHTYSAQDGFSSTNETMIGGVPTRAEDMPKSGTATYKTMVAGAVVRGDTIYVLNNSSSGQSYSSADFSVAFSTGAVSTALNLSGVPINGDATTTNLGNYSGTGALASGGPGFTGTLTGNGINGEFTGALFGPKAAEMGYVWYLRGGDFDGRGVVFGAKK